MRKVGRAVALLLLMTLPGFSVLGLVIPFHLSSQHASAHGGGAHGHDHDHMLDLRALVHGHSHGSQTPDHDHPMLTVAHAIPIVGATQAPLTSVFGEPADPDIAASEAALGLRSWGFHGTGPPLGPSRHSILRI